MYGNAPRQPIPDDREKALLAVITHVILAVRNLASEITPENLFRLMHAVHNIPIYLRLGGEEMWDTVQWDIKITMIASSACSWSLD